MPGSRAGHLHLARPPSSTATGDPVDLSVADLIDAATAWARVQVPPRAAALRTRHLVVVPDTRATTGMPAPTTTP